jgi:hypothetical protein
MADPINPTQVTWQNPATFVDPNNPGSNIPYTAATAGGYMIGFDAAAPAKMPGVTFATSFPLDSYAPYKALASGNHTIKVAAVSKGGVVGEYRTAPFSVDPTLILAPGPVTNLALA